MPLEVIDSISEQCDDGAKFAGSVPLEGGVHYEMQM